MTFSRIGDAPNAAFIARWCRPMTGPLALRAGERPAAPGRAGGGDLPCGLDHGNGVDRLHELRTRRSSPTMARSYGYCGGAESGSASPE